jgi:hypothetical protein
MSAVSPTLGNTPAGGGKSRAELLRLPQLIGDVLLVAVGTLYFWSTAGRHLYTDIGVIWRICARAAALAGLSGAAPDPRPQSRCPGNPASIAQCDSNRKVVP